MRLAPTFSARPALLLLPLLSLLATSCMPSAYNSRGGLGFFGVIYLIMAIYAVISLLKQDWSLGKKLIWGAIIWFFPIGGSIIYLLFSGRSK